VRNDLRNPWHGVDAWREFKYDARHPVRMVRGAVANVNNVPRAQRQLGLAVMGVGAAQALVGVAMLVRGYFF
jgi:hypothetical protein